MEEEVRGSEAEINMSVPAAATKETWEYLLSLVEPAGRPVILTERESEAQSMCMHAQSVNLGSTHGGRADIVNETLLEKRRVR